MSKLLVNEHPLVVLPTLASVIGLNEAIVLQQIHYWLERSKHVIDGNRWIYNTVEQWKEQFPFWSQDTVGRTLRSLREKGVLVAEALNKRDRDRTLYYRIRYEILDAIERCNLPDSKLQNRIIEDGVLQCLEHGNLPCSSLAVSNAPNKTETNSETSQENTFAPTPTGAVVPDLLRDTLPAAKKATVKAAAANNEPKAPELEPLAYVLANGVDEQVARDWLKVRKERRAANTLTAFKAIAREGSKVGLTFAETVTHCAEKGWVGFKATWYEREQHGPTAPAQRGGYMTQQERMRAVSEANIRAALADDTADNAPFASGDSFTIDMEP